VLAFFVLAVVMLRAVLEPRVLATLERLLARIGLSRLSPALDEISGRRLEARGVKQAGFVVLKSVEFPSVLVETAFISNPEEEKRLNEDAYQDQLARAILGGIKRYLAKNPPRPSPVALN